MPWASQRIGGQGWLWNTIILKRGGKHVAMFVIRLGCRECPIAFKESL